MDKRTLTTEEFIRRAKLKHGDKYNYSKSKYIGTHDKIKIICPIHGEFEQEAKAHVYRGSGCITCSGFKPLTTDVFVLRSKEIHCDKYD